PRSCAHGRGGTLPGRPLLSPERLPDPPSTAAAAPRGHPGAGPLLRATPRSTDEPGGRGDLQRDARGAPPLRVAGERPRAREPDRAGDDPVEGTNARGPARRAEGASPAG